MVRAILLRMFLAALTILSFVFFFLGTYQFQRDHVTVAVLDTGIDGNHPMLTGRVLPGIDFISWKKGAGDRMGHGTHVAGIIAENAPEAKILSVRVISDKNRVYNTHLAIMYAIMKGANIVNMSYAESYNLLTELAIRYGRAKGVVFVASSGNRGINDVFYPAKYKGVYSISGFNEQDQTLYGNYGTLVHYLAPGVKVRSAGLDGSYAVKSGTSMAAAYVSGAFAYLQSYFPEHSETELIQLFDQYTTFVVDQRNATENIQYKAVDFSELKTAIGGQTDIAAIISDI